ncbi:hypothetical protein ES705_18212 [subsurface metagenome]
MCVKRGDIMRIVKKSPICPQCNGRYVYNRIKTKDFWCRYCGFTGSKRLFFRKKRKRQAQEVKAKVVLTD